MSKKNPSEIYKPKLFKDGNQWCALYGDNLQEGVSGFGDSPEKAMKDFDENWRTTIFKRHVHAAGIHDIDMCRICGKYLLNEVHFRIGEDY